MIGVLACGNIRHVVSSQHERNIATVAVVCYCFGCWWDVRTHLCEMLHSLLQGDRLQSVLQGRVWP